MLLFANVSDIRWVNRPKIAFFVKFQRNHKGTIKEPWCSGKLEIPHN